MATAYLVAHIDTTRIPPVVTSVAIYSEPNNSLTNGFTAKAVAASILQMTGGDFQEASANLLEYMRLFPGIFGWLLSRIEDGHAQLEDPLQRLTNWRNSEEGEPALDRILRDDEPV